MKANETGWRRWWAQTGRPRWGKTRQVIKVVCLLTFLAFTVKDGLPDRSRAGRIKAEAAPYAFNYLAWELEALWNKAGQSLFGYSPYISETEGKALVLEYLDLVGQILDLEARLETLYADPTSLDPTAMATDLRLQLSDLEAQRADLQPLVEPIIERQVSAVLQAQGFGLLGQILPPVSFRFVETPDVLIVSPRHTIRQDFSISLKPLTVEQKAALEQAVESASPDDSAYVTGVGGVGIWPSMVVETRHPVFAFEIVAHEWAHHYLFMFPLGLEYLMRPETRNINETTATVFGNAIALLALEHFYAEEVAAGRIWLPRYPTLADFQPSPSGQRRGHDPDDLAPLAVSGERDWQPYQRRARLTADYLMTLDRNQAAQATLNAWQKARSVYGFDLPRDPDDARPTSSGVIINRTRITADYLLPLSRMEAAEAYMESRRQALGMRVLNQAWFAFNGGYQADPGQGSGVAVGTAVDVTDPAYPGDPTGAAIHEILALAPTLEDFLMLMRDVTTRAELIEAVKAARSRWND